MVQLYSLFLPSLTGSDAPETKEGWKCCSDNTKVQQGNHGFCQEYYTDTTGDGKNTTKYNIATTKIS